MCGDGKDCVMKCQFDLIPEREELVQQQMTAEEQRLEHTLFPVDALPFVFAALPSWHSDGPQWVALPRRLSDEELELLQNHLRERGWAFRRSKFWRLGDFKIRVGAKYETEGYQSLI
jgi:hypothetical protein